MKCAGNVEPAALDMLMLVNLIGRFGVSYVCMYSQVVSCRISSYVCMFRANVQHHMPLRHLISFFQTNRTVSNVQANHRFAQYHLSPNLQWKVSYRHDDIRRSQISSFLCDGYSSHFCHSSHFFHAHLCKLLAQALNAVLSWKGNARSFFEKLII